MNAFEIDISSFVQEGENLIEVLVVYQNCNTRWYSGAGIFRDVTFINSDLTYLPTDGLYISNKITDDANIWKTKISVEVEGPVDGHKVVTTIADKTGALLITSSSNVEGNKVISEHSVNSPHLWDIDDPFFYIATTQLLDKQGNVIDSITQHCGYKTAVFHKDKGFFLNGRHIKIYGACHHHDHGALGSAFDVNAQRRQFAKLKEMGVNSVRCSHNPPPAACVMKWVFWLTTKLLICGKNQKLHLITETTLTTGVNGM